MSGTKTWDTVEETSEYWRTLGKNQINRAVGKQRIETPAKNVILFIGDGMGIQSMTAGRILMNGEAFETSMDSLDFSGLVKTYNVDYQTPGTGNTV